MVLSVGLASEVQNLLQNLQNAISLPNEPVVNIVINFYPGLIRKSCAAYLLSLGMLDIDLKVVMETGTFLVKFIFVLFCSWLFSRIATTRKPVFWRREVALFSDKHFKEVNLDWQFLESFEKVAPWKSVTVSKIIKVFSLNLLCN